LQKTPSKEEKETVNTQEKRIKVWFGGCEVSGWV